MLAFTHGMEKESLCKCILRHNYFSSRVMLFRESNGQLQITLPVSRYRPQGKVMFSEVCVMLFTGCVWGGSLLPKEVCSWGVSAPPLLPSSGCHCSGRYTSYWNAFLFEISLEVKKKLTSVTFYFNINSTCTSMTWNCSLKSSSLSHPCLVSPAGTTMLEIKI